MCLLNIISCSVSKTNGHLNWCFYVLNACLFIIAILSFSYEPWSNQCLNCLISRSLARDSQIVDSHSKAISNRCIQFIELICSVWFADKCPSSKVFGDFSIINRNQYILAVQQRLSYDSTLNWDLTVPLSITHLSNSLQLLDEENDKH